MRLTPILLAAFTLSGSARPPERRTANLVLFLSDGLRHREIFGGDDASPTDRKAGGVADPEKLRREFWRDLPGQRRAALLPFL